MGRKQSRSFPCFVDLSQKKLAKAQRRHARKKKGSKNRDKARLKVARIHARIADRRRDFSHKLSTRLIRENQTICVESLQVKNMVKNRSLAKAISDVGWSELVSQLEYKAQWYGRNLVKIDTWYPPPNAALTVDIFSTPYRLMCECGPARNVAWSMTTIATPQKTSGPWDSRSLTPVERP
ncbi:hypothetical protein KDH_13010 [Dictyobacter sp. S3.2.2.5]|uniref:Probable transposase IS891/IS1136/IS1341 domain-containing protein n=1 Tax=Dictyobacter halimunensis TaxID=3026934 RepID=A0ABQ6FPW7_9CHLR|nr:hypothetical protein KDH_13010 [Dictyobacter sp. S3.2.2.5]